MDNSKCCKNCYEEWGGGLTMLPLIRKCKNLDCVCHTPQEPEQRCTCIKTGSSNPPSCVNSNCDCKACHSPKEAPKAVYDCCLNYECSHSKQEEVKECKHLACVNKKRCCYTEKELYDMGKELKNCKHEVLHRHKEMKDHWICDYCDLDLTFEQNMLKFLREKCSPTTVVPEKDKETEIFMDFCDLYRDYFNRAEIEGMDMVVGHLAVIGRDYLKAELASQREEMEKYGFWAEKLIENRGEGFKDGKRITIQEVKAWVEKNKGWKKWDMEFVLVEDLTHLLDKI